MLKKIVSGGQTGVDRAALDSAMSLGIPCGGWCPRGRRATDGVIPQRYPLRETRTSEYAERTRCNVRDADATLVLHCGDLSGGTLLTVQFARSAGKPVLCVNLLEPPEAAFVGSWLRDAGVRLLNVAGPREQDQPGIYRTARDWLFGLWLVVGVAGAPTALKV
jgi:hypothetical protein